VPGGNYHDIKLLLTLDQGDSFYEMPDPRAVRRPLTLSLVSPGTEVSGSIQYSAFPTLIDDDPEFGIGLVPAVGVWNQAGLSASPHSSASGYMQLKLSRLDVIAPFEVFTPGSLTVSPSPEGGLHFGKVQVNEPSSATVTLSNPGESPVNCSVRLRDAERVFFMQTVQTLLLPPGGSSTVTLQFNPREVKEYTATLIFESSEGDYHAMTVTGTGEVADKTPGALSCSGTGKGIFFQITAGDGLLLALLGGLLLGFRRRKACTVL
jgi:hypothetical protein